MPCAQEDFWSTVPERDDFVGIRSQGDTECTRQSKICQLEVPLVIDQQVLGFEISMKNASRVAEFDSLDQLVQISL